jgi:8-oxo-dGTP pyrophosphatase MutT (NUDIX family)
MRISEIRDGDTKARAGLVITDGRHLLACKPTPSSRWPNPKLDIPKGHIQAGESPANAAIRECYEETNILFELWKLHRPMVFQMDGEPLYLWEVYLSGMPPIEQLSCVSTFIDDATGQRRPEMAGYEYISLFDVQFHGALENLQDSLCPCVEAYFHGGSGYPFEDRRVCSDRINLPDGCYRGTQSGYWTTLDNGVVFRTVYGVEGRGIPVAVNIRNGFVY